MDVIACSMPDGTVAVVVPAVSRKGKTWTAAEVLKDVPANAVAHEIIEKSALPNDRIFRNAWTMAGNVVSEDLPKAVEIAHTRRRAKREADFVPHDEVISKQIPGADAVAAEAARATIRQADAARQVEIDAAVTTNELRAIIVRDNL